MWEQCSFLEQDKFGLFVVEKPSKTPSSLGISILVITLISSSTLWEGYPQGPARQAVVTDVSPPHTLAIAFAGKPVIKGVSPSPTRYLIIFHPTQSSALFLDFFDRALPKLAFLCFARRKKTQK